jgi:multiple sugar transport system substrate-binding protein
MLRGIGWDHPRCLDPLRAAAHVWHEREGVSIEWEARSLRDFGDQPLEELTASFDLLSIDYPFVGTAAATGCLAPLDELVPDDVLRELAEDSIGPSHASYCFAGHQWGLATDAACQVAVARDDLLRSPAPRTWDDVLELARSRPETVALPLAPADAICSYVTLLVNGGAVVPTSPDRFADRESGIEALDVLCQLAWHGHRDSLDLNPPALLDRMTETDEIGYVPLTFGYTNYSRPGERARPVRFLDIPSAGRGPVGSMLGGAGLAVSAASAYPVESATFAAWISGADAQRTVVAPSGGQPGSSSAWEDPEVDRLTGRFTSGTIETMTAAYVRPREPWWPAFQLAAGDALNGLLRGGAKPERLYDAVEALYRERMP